MAGYRVTYEINRRRAAKAGKWVGYVPAAPVTEHLQTLIAAGMSRAQIGQLAVVHKDTVSDVARGRYAHMQAKVAQALLAVQCAPRPAIPPGQVDATGTGRRIRALATLGHSITAQAHMLGFHGSYLGDLARNRYRTVSAATAKAVAALYRQLVAWPARPGRSATRARGHAAQQGWPGPADWDGDSIDDPAGVPQRHHPEEAAEDDQPDEVAVERVLTRAARFSTLTRDVDRQEVVGILAGRGMTARAIATYTCSSEPVIAKVLKALAVADEAEAAA